jgi:hypothetical protein
MNTAKEVISLALSEVGYLEKKSNSQLDGKTDNVGKNNYTKYARDLDAIAGFYNGKKNGFPWCDVFVDWLFVKSFGVRAAKKLLCQPDKSLGAGCGYSADYYKKNGQFHTKDPQQGDQIFFLDSAGDVAHTGIVYKVDNLYVYTVEGNTSTTAGVISNGGCVAKKHYALDYSRIYGYGRPAYDKEKTEENKEIDEYFTIKMRVLKNGCEGDDVRALQILLIGNGFTCGSWGADGNFGAATETAVRNYQKANKLQVDGKAGPATMGKLLGIS